MAVFSPHYSTCLPDFASGINVGWSPPTSPIISSPHPPPSHMISSPSHPPLQLSYSSVNLSQSVFVISCFQRYLQQRCYYLISTMYLLCYGMGIVWSGLMSQYCIVGVSMGQQSLWPPTSSCGLRLSPRGQPCHQMMSTSQ